MSCVCISLKNNVTTSCKKSNDDNDDAELDLFCNTVGFSCKTRGGARNADARVKVLRADLQSNLF